MSPRHDDFRAVKCFGHVDHAAYGICFAEIGSAGDPRFGKGFLSFTQENRRTLLKVFAYLVFSVKAQSLPAPNGLGNKQQTDLHLNTGPGKAYTKPQRELTSIGISKRTKALAVWSVLSRFMMARFPMSVPFLG